MKWILCGKNDAAVDALEFLCEQGDEVWAVGTHGDAGVDGWQRSFVGAAKRLGVPLDQPRRINDPAFVQRLAAYSARALVSIQYDQILKGPLFEAIGCPCLNLHFALLPRHRGVSPMAWAILDGDREAGVTLHHMVVDIDAGDLLGQNAVPVRRDDTARDLYDKVSAAAAALFRQSYPFESELLGARLPQDVSQASYHMQGDFDFSQREVDWGRPAAELQNWLRAMIFPPFQFPEIQAGGRTLCVKRVAGGVADSRGAEPGTVLASSAECIRVAAAGGAISITELGDPNDLDASHEELRPDIEVGARLSSGAQEKRA